MLLLIDHLALRARNYEYLIRLFQEWEAHRNLSQLPNFAFSVPLAYFLLSQQADLPEQELNSAREQASPDPTGTHHVPWSPPTFA